MNFEPQRFFIGLIDFFSVLLPGAILTYLLEPRFFNPSYHELASAEGRVVFLFSSYLLGHFLFLLGSWLDDYGYDPLRKATDKEQIKRLLSGRALSPRPVMWLAGIIFKKNADAAVDRVIPLNRH